MGLSRVFVDMGKLDGGSGPADTYTHNPHHHKPANQHIPIVITPLLQRRQPRQVPLQRAVAEPFLRCA